MKSRRKVGVAGLAIVALFGFATVAGRRPAQYEMTLSVSITSVVNSQGGGTSHWKFTAIVDRNGDVHAVSIDDDGSTVAESLTRGAENWVRYPGFNWIEDHERLSIQSLAPDHPLVAAAVSGWRKSGRSGELDLYRGVDLTPMLAVLPLGPVTGIAVNSVSSAIGDVSIGDEHLTINGRVIGAAAMIGQWAEIPGVEILQIDFEYSATVASAVSLFDPTSGVASSDGLARFESAGLSFTFALPDRLAGQMTVEPNGAKAHLRSASRAPNDLTFWVRDVRQGPESMPVLWSRFVGEIGGVPQGPSRSAATEQASAYGMGTYDGTEAWFATVVVGNQLVGLTSTAASMSETEFLALLISMKSRSI